MREKGERVMSLLLRKYFEVGFERVQTFLFFFILRERKRGAFHAEGPKTEKTREPLVGSLARGMCRILEAESIRNSPTAQEIRL